jgi:hypothetical protein
MNVMTPFDPYHKWLGIPPKEQPAGPRRLLGISEDENDPQVVREAALRQTAFVRQFSMGEHGEHADRILGELADARDSILSGKVESPTKSAVKPTPSPVETIATPLVNVAAKSATVATKAPASWYRTQWGTFSITAAAMLILFAIWPSAEMSVSSQDDSLVKENEELGIQIKELNKQKADLELELAELAIASKARTIGKTTSPLIPAEAVSFQGHRYHLIENKVPWHQAEMDAAAMGGYLIRLESTAEHDFVISWLKELNCGFHVHIDGTRFLDGETFLFSDNREMPLDLLHKGNIKGLPQKNWEQFLFLAAGNFHINSWHFHQCFYIVEWSVDQIPNSLNPIADISGSLEEGLVAYYPFNGNANDESGNEQDCAVRGAVLSKDRFGKPESGYSFNGVDQSISGPRLELAELFTVSVWFEFDSPHEGVLVNFNNPVIPGGTFATIFAHHFPNGRFRFNNRAGGGGGGGINVFADTSLHGGDWHHSVCVKDEGFLSLFIDGKLSSRIKDVTTRKAVYVNLRVGENINNLFFKGTLDDIRIYNRALSAEEVKTLYEFEKP